MKYCFSILIFIVTLIFNQVPSLAASSSCPENMVLISGGTFRMGSDHTEFLEEKAIAKVRATINYDKVGQAWTNHPKFLAPK